MVFNYKNRKEAYKFQPYDIPKLQNWLLQNVNGIQSLNPEEASDTLEKFRPQIEQMGFTIQEVRNMLPDMMKNTKKLEDLQNTNPLPPLGEEQATVLAPAASSQKNNIKVGEIKPFNIKKAQQYGSLPEGQGLQTDINDSPELIGDNLEMQQDTGSRKFSSGVEVQKWLTQETDLTGALSLVAQNDDGTGKADLTKELIEDFYVSMDDPMKSDARELERKAGEIYDSMPETMKSEGEYMAQFKEFSTDEIIKKLAKEHISQLKSKSFNLKKTAQHKTQENVIMWGPAETRKVDPFLRQPVSDWHIIERNKGFGLVVDDVWNIDYETIWRQNIMDKYSRPYRDKDGNWVGGYIQKRFEVDKNIPAINNIQLKPGQKRKPILPEYGNIESRLQAARAKGDIEGAINKDKPFNWKEAKVKVSEDAADKWLREHGAGSTEYTTFSPEGSWPENISEPEISPATDSFVPGEYDQEMIDKHPEEIQQLRSVVSRRNKTEIGSLEYENLTKEIARIAEQIFGTGSPFNEKAASSKKKM